MSEERATYSYHPEQHPLGYMPLPEVYAALDTVLAFARNAESPAVDAGRRFLMRWHQLGVLPTPGEVEQARQDMGAQIDALTAAFNATLRAFVVELDAHPSALPGSPFGDYFHDLVDLSSTVSS